MKTVFNSGFRAQTQRRLSRSRHAPRTVHSCLAAAQVLVATAPMCWGMSAAAQTVVILGTQFYDGSGATGRRRLPRHRPAPDDGPRQPPRPRPGRPVRAGLAAAPTFKVFLV